MGSSCLPLSFFAFFASIIFVSAAFSLASATPKLIPGEVETLKQIGKKLRKSDWDFDKDPCSGEGNWNVLDDAIGLQSSVACDCSFVNSTVCHVVSVDITYQNLTGVLPPEFSFLTYLYHLNLARNLITGPIPSQWASLKLTELDLMGNRLTGPFPQFLTNMTTLTNLSIEGNFFTGSIPPEIGNLKNLSRCFLSSNYFSEELPQQFEKLVNLVDLRINDNNFSGKLPETFSKFTQIQKLHIQGSGFEGPIPPSIFSLTKITDLRISDLQGTIPSTLPSLDSMESLKILILRNCQLNGRIPAVIGKPKKVKHLDLSFNNLTGGIPLEFEQLSEADFIYLTSNTLTGVVPQWLLQRSKIATDLSYNNFTLQALSEAMCPSESGNFLESFSVLQVTVAQSNCATRNFVCPLSKSQQRSSLHINCGGYQVDKYEADIEPRGPSTYVSQGTWSYSSTGNFMDNNATIDKYIIKTNVSSLRNVSSTHSELYTTARVSPLSLTYYGLCLFNGNYNVTLHFAEIVFTSDNTVSSLGRRIFDVYIQDELKLKDFNIAEDAGGAGIPTKKTFTVNVDKNRIKIHFQWAGKGTVGIPLRGVYGPLISAISVEPNFNPALSTIVEGSNTGKVVIGIVFGVVFLILLLLAALLFCRRMRGNSKKYTELNSQTGTFSLKQLKAATKNFDASNKLGEGGFGSVYKGLLSDGSLVAVKQLSTRSKQGNREFVNEVGMISGLQHPNLVKLYGCCIEGKELMLVYEYMENNCLSRALYGKDGIGMINLDWPTRKRICMDVARGLAYLHEESAIKIVHRDIKASNVLLDKKLNAKISDFGLAKLINDDESHISTRIAGTIGYMSPEYAMRGYLTDKADVYSFGVVVLEIVTGKSNTNFRQNDDFLYLLDWANAMQKGGTLTDLVDPILRSNYSPEEAIVILNVALLCTNASPTLRPTMSEVVSILEGKSNVRDFLYDLSAGAAAISSTVRGGDKHFWQDQSITVNGLSGVSSYVETEVSELHADLDLEKDDDQSV